MPASSASNRSPVLDVTNLETTFATPEGEVKAVSGVNFAVYPGEAVGIVGESGSGKSQIFMSIMGLLASNGRARGSVKFHGQEILGLPVAELNKIRGARMSMIFQDPMTSLNPYLTVSRQLTEVLVTHKGMSEAQARSAAIAMLDRVQIPEAAQRFDMYPHEFSGGMRSASSSRSFWSLPTDSTRLIHSERRRNGRFWRPRSSSSSHWVKATMPVWSWGSSAPSLWVSSASLRP